MALVLVGKISCYNAMTLAATTSVASLAAHQVLISVFFVGCKFGDAVSQTAQAYLPACLPQLKNGPAGLATGPTSSAPARRLCRRLLGLGVGLAAFVSTGAFLVATRFPTLFSSAPAVLGAVRGCAGLLFVSLLLHAPTMAAEGLLIGSLQVNFLAKTYVVNVCVFLSALYVVGSRRLGLGAVWLSLAAFQLVRLALFSLRLRGTGLAFTVEKKGADRG